MTKHLTLIVIASLVFSSSAIAQTRGKVRAKRPVAATPANAINGLTRAKAAQMIIKAEGLPRTVTVQIWKRYPKDARHDDWGVCMVVSDKQFSDRAVQEQLNKLVDMGLITIGEQTTREAPCTYTWATISLTDAGRSNLLTEYEGVYYMKAYEIAFGEVTGIQFVENSMFAVVEFTLKAVNQTSFGLDAPKQPWGMKANFALYDDGWRIKQEEKHWGLKIH